MTTRRPICSQNSIASPTKLNAEPVKVGVLLDNDNLNIFIDDGGRYHYSYWERGADQTSTASARWVTSSIGSLRG